jgi:hypothetical protein
VPPKGWYSSRELYDPLLLQPPTAALQVDEARHKVETRRGN